jgi:UDP-N-acetylmuramoyl-L-alanyl-D-glutamate--2,6-diaminopimelate ligase
MMKLTDILKNIKVLDISGPLDRFVADIQYDSRKVGKDHAFVAIAGFQEDGHRYIDEAYRKGARVFFVEKKTEIKDSTIIMVKSTRRTLSQIARIFFGKPDQKLKIIGITGTTGKTTTAYLIHSILEAAHWRPGLITTVETYDGKNWLSAERTTPEALDIYRLFASLVRQRMKSAVMEVSSHALSLHRVEDIRFTAGVFTNLGRDHLDFHETMENYFLAKRKLFEKMHEHQRVVLNADDNYSARIMETTGGEVFTYSMTDRDCTVSYITHESDKGGMILSVKLPSGNITVRTALLGDFNIYNILAATTLAVSLGIQQEFISAGIENLIRVPGRCEAIPVPAGYSVFIDYAHTPESLYNILRAVWVTRPRTLIVVFGAGGDRDRGKRPEMGKAAEDFADQIILTNDNPRSEDPEQIIEEIAAGISDRSRLTIMADRREAIRMALDMASDGDCVVIAGKGHETYQDIEGNRYHFDDHEVVEEYFEPTGKPISG